MDARPHTLRELVWMTRGRQRSEWGRLAALIQWTVKALTGVSLTDRDIIPAAYRSVAARPQKKSEAQLEIENKAAWAAMDRFFRGK